MSDELLKDLERAWRAEPRDSTWVALAVALERSGRPFASELRRSGRRLGTLRARLAAPSRLRDEGDRRAAQEIVLSFAARQARRAARALRRAVEADLDPRGLAWRDGTVEVQVVDALSGKPGRTVLVPPWVYQVGRNVWFLDRARRRRKPSSGPCCRCGHDAREHFGELPRTPAERSYAPGRPELGPLKCGACDCPGFRVAGVEETSLSRPRFYGPPVWLAVTNRLRRLGFAYSEESREWRRRGRSGAEAIGQEAISELLFASTNESDAVRRVEALVAGFAERGRLSEALEVLSPPVMTTIRRDSDGAGLPASVLWVQSTEGFPEGSAGRQRVNYSGKTPFAFVGCVGGEGSLVAGNVVELVRAASLGA